MVGKINRGDDSGDNIPYRSGELSFKHDYTSPQQRVMNEHINELKNLLKSENVHDPEVQQQIAQLRHQIQYKDLPAVGLSERRKPTVTDAMQYIDKESGYAAHAEKMASVEQVSVSKKSKKSSWRQLAGSAPAQKSKAPKKTHFGGLGTGDDVQTIQQNLQNWQAQHQLTPQMNTIVSNILQAIPKFENNQNNADSLRSWLQLAPDSTGIKNLFNTNIYHNISASDLTSLFGVLGLDKSLLPSKTTPSLPPFPASKMIGGQKYVAFVFNNLPSTMGSPPAATTLNIGAILQGDSSPSYMTGYAGVDGTPTYSKNQADGKIPLSSLPTFTDASGKQQHYVYLPQNMTSGRIYYNWHPVTAGDYPPFTEFNMDQNGNPNVNFTAVDNMPKLTSSVQLSGDYQLTNLNGVQTSSDDFYAKMSTLYDRYDPSGEWKKNMYAMDGSIRSGKHMGVGDTKDSTIQNTFAGYMNSNFFSYFSQHPLYFTADAPTFGEQKGIIQQAPGGGWQMSITSDAHPQPVIIKLPDATDMNNWMSGAFGAPPPGAQQDEINIRWGAAKALSSIINKGILPQDTNTSPTNLMNGKDYFTNPDNIQNFYKASYDGKPAYNIYLRALHEAGCSAYGADFDDYMGGDGSVSDVHENHPYVVINFGGTSPTPPAFDPDQVASDLFNKDLNFQKAWNGESVVALIQSKTNSMNNAIAAYKANPTQDAWNKLNAQYQTYQSDIAGLRTQASGLANNMFIYQFGPDLKAEMGRDPTAAERKEVADSLASHETAQVNPLPPSPSGPFDPNAAVDKLWAFTGYGIPPNNVNIPNELLKHVPMVNSAISDYNAEVTRYKNMSPQDQAKEWPAVQKAYVAALDVRGMAGGYNVLFGSGSGPISDEACRIIGLPQPMTQKQAEAIGDVMDARYLPQVPDLPAPPGPPGPTPDQETNAIYNDKNMKPPFHDQFTALPVFGEIKQYQVDLANYTKNPTTAGYTALVAEFNKVSQDLAGLNGAVLGLLNKNSAEIQSLPLKISPADFPKIASYIIGTQEKGNIPTITPPTPPGPPGPTPTYFDIQSFKDYIDQDWLPNQPGESSYNPFTHTGPQGYLRLIIDNLFSQIDTHKFANMGQMISWINNVAIKDPNLLGKLLDPNIYKNNPDFVKMGPVAAQAELKDLFSKLMITAQPPQPGPPGPPPVPPDLDKLFKQFPSLSSLYHNNEVPELRATLKGEGPTSHSKNVINLMSIHKGRYVDFLQKQGYSAADVSKLATELSNQEWTDAGGKTPPGPPVLP